MEKILLINPAQTYYSKAYRESHVGSRCNIEKKLLPIFRRYGVTHVLLSNVPFELKYG